MDDYADPITIWTESSTIAPSDLIFYEHPSIPEWEGRFLITVLKDKHLRAVKVDDTDGDQVLEGHSFISTMCSVGCVIYALPLMVVCSLLQMAQHGPIPSRNTHKIVELKNSAYVPVGMNEVNNAHLRVYPNPASAVVNVGLPADWMGGALSGSRLHWSHPSH
jgi:hypothetical protein